MASVHVWVRVQAGVRVQGGVGVQAEDRVGFGRCLCLGWGLCPVYGLVMG